MGTNYYLIKPSELLCNKCGHDPDVQSIHIGKSSFGWCFGLHIIPELNIFSLDDWKREWSKDGVYIQNEYKEKISTEEMLKIITDRGNGRYCKIENKEEARKEEPISSIFKSLKIIKKQKIKNIKIDSGLMRHSIDGSFCTGHGEGPWDYLVGDYS